ncbi:hypothetical protein OEZ86_008882 [Tetradesmus obliquus]|nr:hypothetical protein OEZ86_008882 [Tetradesmus obliquus]
MVSAGTLLTWVLQRPELITTDRPTVPGSRLLAALYHESHRCLAMTVIAIVGVGRSSSSSSSSSGGGGGGGQCGDAGGSNDAAVGAVRLVARAASSAAGST